MSEPRVVPTPKPNRLLSYWYKERHVVAAIVLFGVVFNTATVLGPMLQGQLIDTLVAQEPLTVVVRQTILFVGAILLIQGTRFWKRFYVRRFSNNVSASMRLVIYHSVLRRETAQLDQENMGSLMTKVISDVELCVEGMRKVTTEVFDTGVLMTAYLVSMLAYDWNVTLFSCCFFPIAMVLAERIKGAIYRYTTAYRTASSQAADLTYETVDHTLLLRVNGLEGQSRERYAAALEDLRRKAVKASVLENSLQPLYNIIALLGIVAVVWMGGGNVVDGRWTVGDFSAYLAMFMAITTKASKAAKLFNAFQKSQVSWRRIQPYLEDYQPDFDGDSPSAGGISPAELNVEHLTFAYPGQVQPVVTDLSFSAKAGQIIGITGPIASGKSALGVALAGLYPYGGSIRVNGRELRDLSAAQRSAWVAWQGHDPQLLSDTIRSNMELGRALPLEETLENVQLTEDLAAMPDGLETLVGSSGVRLSGGQQARLALARALVGKPPILLLDDPFSAVDKATEQAIITHLREQYRESIILLFSHRLAIFDQVDHILLLHADHTVEQGSHWELMEQSTLYHTIYQLQQGREEGQPCETSQV